MRARNYFLDMGESEARHRDAFTLGDTVKGFFRQRRNYLTVAEHRIPTVAIALRGAVIDSSLGCETQPLNVYTYHPRCGNGRTLGIPAPLK